MTMPLTGYAVGMAFKGTWRNQYDSLVEITNDDDGGVEGWFDTAIESSPFFGSRVPITGAHSTDAIAFVCAAENANVVVSYTGKLQDGKLETLWFVVNGDDDWWRSVITNHDTYTKLL